MLVIVYDEHGGFYDHVDPTQGLPPEFADRAEFGHFGPRVPAFVVSPFVEAGAAFGSAQDNDPRFVFDHTALIKTILLRFAHGDDGRLPPRVASSSHLGHVLTDGPARRAPEVSAEEVKRVTDWWAKHIAERLKHPSATVPALQELGLVEGPGGFEAGTQDIAATFGRAVDWIKARFRHGPERNLAAANRDAQEEGVRTTAVLADTSELQLGIAAAARQVRKQGLPPGQP